MSTYAGDKEYANMLSNWDIYNKISDIDRDPIKDRLTYEQFQTGWRLAHKSAIPHISLEDIRKIRRLIK